MFGSVKSNLLSREPLPSLDEAYSALIQDEDSRVVSRVFKEKVETMAHFVRTIASSSILVAASQQSQLTREERMKLHCSNCNCNVHLSTNCFWSLGYLSWWGDRPRSRIPSVSGCGSQLPTSSTPRANTVMTSASSNHSTNALTASDRIGLTGLNDIQWQTFVTMLNERKPSSTSKKITGMHFLSSWIIDT